MSEEFNALTSKTVMNYPEICLNDINCNISDKEAIKILGTMQGGYNVEIMINLLNNNQLAPYVVVSADVASSPASSNDIPAVKPPIAGRW